MGILNFLNKLKSRGQTPLPQDVENHDTPTADSAMIETAPMEVNTNISARPLAAIPFRSEFEAQKEQAGLMQNATNSFTPMAAAPSAMPPPTNTPETPGVTTPPALAVNPYTQRRVDADQALADAQNKDWKGKDRDTDHNWWDAVKSGLLGAGVGFLKGGLGGAIVGGATGGISGAVDRNADEKFINNNFTLPRLQQTAESAREAEQGSLRADGQASQNDWYKVRPQIEQQKADTQRFKADADAEYKSNQIALGTKKADELKVYRDAIVDLKERGADQNDTRIKLLEKTLEEAKRRNTEAEKDKDFDREARIKVAQIMSQTQLATTGMREQGQNNRQQIAIQAQQKLVDLKNLQEQESKETDFNRKQQLQAQRQQLQKELLDYRKQLAREQ